MPLENRIVVLHEPANRTCQSCAWECGGLRWDEHALRAVGALPYVRQGEGTDAGTLVHPIHILLLVCRKGDTVTGSLVPWVLRTGDRLCAVCCSHV